MKKIAYSLFVLLATACSEEKTADTTDTTGTAATADYSTQGKTVLVYTTADSTDYRLSSTGTLAFTPFPVFDLLHTERKIASFSKQ